MYSWLIVLSWIGLFPCAILLTLKVYWLIEYEGSLLQQSDRIHQRKRTWLIGFELATVVLAGSFLITHYFM